MKPFKKYLIICAAFNALLILSSLAGGGEAIMVPFFVCLIEFFVAVVLCIIPQSRSFGKALLLAALVGAVVGFSVCSMNFRLDTR